VTKRNHTDIFLDSLINSQSYDIIKAIYASHGSEDAIETRLSVIQHTLGQLRLPIIATLDSLTTHFTRLIELTSADEEYIVNLSQTLAPCILRPKDNTALNMEDRHPYRLVRDLFAHKDAIFGELKRSNSAARHTPGPQTAPAAPAAASQVPGRPRVGSTEETAAARRQAFEAKLNAASTARSRATSPAPGPRTPFGHRREGSTNVAETRFPIATPNHATHRDRNSLEARASISGSTGERSGTLSPPIPGSYADGTSIGGEIPQTETIIPPKENVPVVVLAAPTPPADETHASSTLPSRTGFGRHSSRPSQVSNTAVEPNVAPTEAGNANGTARTGSVKEHHPQGVTLSDPPVNYD
jgi:hypothetical protein